MKLKFDIIYNSRNTKFIRQCVFEDIIIGASLLRQAGPYISSEVVHLIFTHTPEFVCSTRPRVTLSLAAMGNRGPFYCVYVFYCVVSIL